MPFIPICLKIEPGRRCLVVGGGLVALRKVAWLLGCGAAIDVIAPEIVNEMAGLPDHPTDSIALFREAYGSRDLSGYALVIAATDEEAVNALVAEDARRAGAPVNVVDRPELCTFFVPATLWRGNLQVALNTGGECPGLAARLRQELEAQLPDWYGDFTAALGAVRREMGNAEFGMGNAEFRVIGAEERRGLMTYLASREMAEGLKNLDLDKMKGELRRQAAAWLQRRRPAP
jgi:siroheme synthase-like protein